MSEELSTTRSIEEESKKKGRKITVNYKENKSEYHRNYYHLNKDKWNKRKEQLVMCETCCKSYRLHKRSQHMKTQKHLMCVQAFQNGIMNSAH